MQEELDDDRAVLVAVNQRRSEQYRSWLAKARQSVEKAKDRPAPYTLPRQISVEKQVQIDLLRAVLCNDFDQVMIILMNEPVDSSITDSEGNSALSLAARNGNFEIVELLLQHGFPINKMNARKRTALMYAGKGGHSAIVNRLLTEETCDVDAQDSEGNTVLIMATKRHHYDIVEILLASGRCDVNRQNRYGHAALHDAAKLGRMELVAMMVFHGANKDVQDRWKSTPLMYATLHGHSNCVALLIQSSCDVNLVNMGGRTALHTAAQNGHGNIVSLLLHADALMDTSDLENDTPVLLAGRYQHYSILKMLIAKGCNVKMTDSFGKNVFHLVVQNGYKDLVIELLDPKYSINPEAQDRNGSTALMYAVRRNHASILEILLRQNCSVRRSLKTGGKEFPLFVYAVSNGYVDLLRPLAEAGADVGCYHRLICQGLVPSAILADPEMLEWLRRISTTPKALQQLCRDNIREMLSCGLEMKIDGTMLPTKLKNYILMKE